ncbi:MAG: bifunctional phosphoribosyl-AMP cyclohydrolase/phosphoribosyl-ATP diphosphatase HisIE [Acidobacteria bacterium]|nr:MAG: bifunctional phosphoribosyl-AMP cyclohydrolase/phosphoribosyl-ATP diphosphatase HisIE [Acidobacteriota bacterium]
MDPNQLDWTKLGGLVPAIVQDQRNGRLLMLAFMNRKAFEKTVETKLATFWSRSRQKLWCKGETSGNYLEVKSIHTDCDADSILLLVEPRGPACHLGTKSCFFPDNFFSGLEFLGYLADLIKQRKAEMPQDSYTTELFEGGMTRIAKKLGEEAVEVVVSAGEDKQRSVEETADLLYHLLVFLQERGISLREVIGELERRHSPS